MDSDAREEIEDSLAHIIPRKPFPQYIDEAVFLDVKKLLAEHPDKLLRTWSENPRLYTLLRMLGYGDDSTVFQKFDSEKIGDLWLPLGLATLNQLSSSTGIAPRDWQRAQLHLLSKSELMSEEKLLSPVHAHRFINYGDSHFVEIEKLGKAGSAEVARVCHKLSGKHFAFKRIQRAVEIKAQRKQLIEFEQEVRVLQRISHHHLVGFVASFTDLTSFSLILNPVAEDVLKSMLERQSRDKPLPDSDISTLRRAFGCLATALAYLHAQKVRHRNITPGNILLSDGRVILCDFAISRDWSVSENSTNEGVMKFTRRYCAPEIFGLDATRNTKSDIWSLGCVFLEILSVIKGYPLEEVNYFLIQHSDGGSAQGLWNASETINAWLIKLRTDDSIDNAPLDWITPMIFLEAENRLKASELLDMIQKLSAGLQNPGLFVGSCCSISNSIALIDSLPLHEPVSGGLGIVGVPPRTSLLDPPHHFRDLSISPRTQNLVSGESGDTVSFAKDLVDGPVPPAGGSVVKLLRHVSSRSDKYRTSRLFSPPLSESEASSEFRRSPIPPPANFLLRCACAIRSDEKHIFNAPYASSTAGTPRTSSPVSQTIETCARCDIGENKVQIYETLPKDPSAQFTPVPMAWWVTRRLVVSYQSGNPEMRRCSSFWLPLADIQFNLSGNAVTLHWSDCNQMTQRHSGNYNYHYDWVYDAKNPNNNFTIQFDNISEVQQFINAVRLPFDDGMTVSRGRSVYVSGSSELNIFDIGRRGVRNYRVANLTTAASTLATSKLFIQWPELDLGIRIYDSPEYHMVVEVKNVATPTYHSDVRGESAADYDKVARFNKALQSKTSLVVTFPMGMGRSLPTPPTAMVDMLRGLTDWTLCYFAIVTKIRLKKKRFGSKKYGSADVMLWKREVDDSNIGVKRHGAVVTIRLHEETDLPWMSGTITHSTYISHSAEVEATITVSSKTRGKLLDVRKMIAIASESPKTPSQAGSSFTSDPHKDQSHLVLTFEDARDWLEFVKLIEEFKTTTAATTPLIRKATSAASIHRISNLASSDEEDGNVLATAHDTVPRKFLRGFDSASKPPSSASQVEDIAMQGDHTVGSIRIESSGPDINVRDGATQGKTVVRQSLTDSQPTLKQRVDEETRPVLSGQSSEKPGASLLSTLPDQWRNEVVDEIISVLAKNHQLLPVYEKALTLISSDQFEIIFCRLLRTFRLDLLELPWTQEMHELTSLLESRYTLQEIARKVVQKQTSSKKPLNDEATFTKLEQLFVDGKTPPLPACDPAAPSSNASENSALDTRYELDKLKISAEELPSQSDISQRCKVDRVIQTFVECQPFQDLIIGLKGLLLPHGLLHDIQTIPRHDITIDVSDRPNLLDKIQGWVEDVTTMEWDWWPLGPRMRPLGDGETRVRWRCHCGSYRFRELRPAQREILEDLLTQFPTRPRRLPLCALLKRNAEGTLHAGLQPGSGSGSEIQLQNTPNQQNISTLTATASSSSSNYNPSSHLSGNSTLNRLPGGAKPITTLVPTACGYQQKKPFWLLFGVEGARENPEWDQMGDENLDTDINFLANLQRKHHQLRGWIRSHTSIRQLKYWDFVKFRRVIVQPGRIYVSDIGLPNSPEYDYNRDPPGLSRHDFEVLVRSCLTPCSFSLFHSCNPIEKDVGIVEYLPKRNCEFKIMEKYPIDKEVWGIQARYLPSAIRIFLLHIALLPVSAGFWFWWLRNHPGDIQGASVPFFVLGTLVAAFWTTASVVRSLS